MTAEHKDLAPTSVYRAALLALEDAKRLDMGPSDTARHVTDAVLDAWEDVTDAHS